MAVVLSTKEPIYPMLKWDDYMTYVYVVGMLVFYLACFFLFYFLAQCKNKRYCDKVNKDIDEESIS